MYFDLTDEQKMLQAGLREMFAENVDLNALTQAAPNDVAALRIKTDAALAAIGAPAALAAQAHGGLGLGLLTLTAISEELGRSAAPSGSVRNALAAWLIGESGSDAQRADWLEPLLTNARNAAFAPDEMMLVGEAVSGVSRCVEGGDSADLYIVPVANDGLALVPRSANVSVETAAPLDVSRPTSVVHFNAAAAELLSPQRDTSARLRQAQYILLAADAFGAGQRAHDMAVAYVQERRQFDRPIGAFQAIKHQLADTILTLAPARFLPWRAAHAWDCGSPETARFAALAKAHTPEIAVATARAMVEAHGGVGYTWEYPLHLFLKRAMFDRVSWGGPAFHRAAAAQLAAW